MLSARSREPRGLLIGGNIATNAGGPRCLKYGVTRDYVLGLEVVLADGSIVRLGGRTHKNKTGFDLHRLFVGSEGLLGVITEATLKLIPLPPYRAVLAIGFASMRDALQTLHAIFAAGILPCALEVALNPEKLRSFKTYKGYIQDGMFMLWDNNKPAEPCSLKAKRMMARRLYLLKP